MVQHLSFLKFHFLDNRWHCCFVRWKNKTFVRRKNKTFSSGEKAKLSFVWCQNKTFLSGVKANFSVRPKNKTYFSPAPKRYFRMHQNDTFACTKMLLFAWTSRKPYFLSGVGLDFAQTIFLVWCWSGVLHRLCLDFAGLRANHIFRLVLVWCLRVFPRMVRCFGPNWPLWPAGLTLA